MGSLKDALKQAGFSSSKTQNERGKTRGKVMTKTEKNQFTRNFCEVCERTLPDVERYKHRNPTVDAQWICVGCADLHMIEDRFRVTAQSDFAKSNRFKRFYGETIKLDLNKEKNTSGPNRNADGNRGASNKSSHSNQNQNRPHQKNNNGNRGNHNGSRNNRSDRNNSNRGKSGNSDDNFGNR